MSIEMTKGLPFTVDTWSSKNDGKRYHFLSHAHKDHLKGIESRASYPIYATRITITIVLNYYPQLDKAIFVEIKVGETLVINDADGDFSVTVCDANHCYGAVMFIFEGIFGNILHTGDCRLTADCLQDLPLKYVTKRGKEKVSRFDFIFLDCTFGGCFLKFPTKQSAIQQVIDCIWKHPHAPLVYLACELLGHEEILIEVSRTFGSKIYIDQSTSPDCFNNLAHTAPHVISNDPSCRFQVVRFQGLYQRTQDTLINAQINHQPTPLFIRPSTQWYAIASKARAHTPSLTEPEQDEFGLWHVCFSMHSSREELELALELLQPKWVISTTPPSLAMELSYVKNHCFGESEIKTMAGGGVWQVVSSLCPRFSDNWCPAATVPQQPQLTSNAQTLTRTTPSPPRSVNQTPTTSPATTPHSTPNSQAKATFYVSPHSPFRLRFPPSPSYEEWRGRCFKCCRTGHNAASCQNPIKCGKCWLDGHVGSRCSENVLNPEAMPYWPATAKPTEPKPNVDAQFDSLLTGSYPHKQQEMPEGRPSTILTQQPNIDLTDYEGYFDDEELFPMSTLVSKELCQGRDPSSIPLPLRAVLAGAPTTRLTKEQLIHYVPPTQFSQNLITTANPKQPNATAAAGEQLNQSLPLTIAEPQVDRIVTPHGDKRVLIKQSRVQQDRSPLDYVNSSNNSGKEGWSRSTDETINLHDFRATIPQKRKLEAQIQILQMPMSPKKLQAGPREEGSPTTGLRRIQPHLGSMGENIGVVGPSRVTENQFEVGHQHCVNLADGCGLQPDNVEMMGQEDNEQRCNELTQLLGETGDEQNQEDSVRDTDSKGKMEPDFSFNPDSHDEIEYDWE